MAKRYWGIYQYWNNGDASFSGISEVELRTSAGGSDITGVGTTCSISGATIQSGAAANMIDNNATTQVQVNGNVAGTQYRFDLGAGNDADVVEVVITGNKDATTRSPRFFEIRSSTDNWATFNVEWVGYYTGWVLGTAVTFTKPSPVAARYWMMRALTLGTGTSLGVRELEFRATAGGSDTTGSKTYRSQTVFGGFPASNAFDDNLSTLYSGSSGRTGSEFLDVDHGSGNNFNIVQLSINPRADGSHAQAPLTGEMLSSPDGRSYAIRWGFTASTWASGVAQVFTKNLPTITSISPTSGDIAGGTSVTITGTNFSGGTTGVKFGTTAATAVVVVNNTTITCDTPAHSPGAVDVTVEHVDGDVTLTNAFTYSTLSPPSFTSITPDTGSIAGGEAVVIVGDLFTGSTAVKFDTTAGTSFSVIDDETIHVTTPAHAAGLVNVVIENPNGNETAVDAFEFITPPPVITSITPTQGNFAGTTAVTIVGDFFTGATGVLFDTDPATSFVVVDDETITCVIPAHAVGLVDVTVLSPHGDTTEPDFFEYIIPLLQTRITQVPVIVVYRPIQPVRITQVPVIVLNLPIQGTRITQAAVIPLWTPHPVPLPAPIVPDGDVTETWEWKTVVVISDNGRESRAALRPSPRYLIEFTGLILDEEDRRLTYQMMAKYIKQSFTYPMYQYNVTLHDDAFIGESYLYFNTAKTDVRAGEQLALFNPQMDLTYYVTIDEVNSDGVSLASPLEFDVPAFWYACPAMTFNLPPVVGLNMRSIDGEFPLTMQSMEPRDFTRPGAAPTLTMFDGMLVLKERPLADGEVAENFEQNIEWIDNETAAPVVRTNFPIPFISGERVYKAQRWQGLDYWRGVAAHLKGRQNPFLLPTFRDDLPLTEVPALGATHIITSNVQYFDFWRSPTYQYLRIETANGPIYRKVAEALGIYDPTTGIPVAVDIKLTQALGAVAGDNVITKVSYMNITRLASDAIKLIHHEADISILMSVRSIEA